MKLVIFSILYDLLVKDNSVSDPPPYTPGFKNILQRSAIYLIRFGNLVKIWKKKVPCNNVLILLECW